MRKKVLAFVFAAALLAALGGTAVAVNDNAPNPKACEHSQAAHANANALANANGNSAVHCP